MKKINSIHYGGKVISIGILFAFVIPIILRLIPLKSSLLYIISMISIIIGTVILLGFSIWLGIEFHQDKKLNHYYEKHKSTKLEIEKDRYECQSCGNRNIKSNDRSCSVCGTSFNNCSCKDYE